MDELEPVPIDEPEPVPMPVPVVCPKFGLPKFPATSVFGAMMPGSWPDEGPGPNVVVDCPLFRPKLGLVVELDPVAFEKVPV
jgi:hypothetical protein